MELKYALWGQSKESGEASTSAKPRALFLHGMGGTGALWRPIAAALEEDFQILGPDQRGHGGSIVTDTSGGRTRVGYTPLDYGQDVVQTLDALGFHPTWVVGHSMGVRTACAVAHLRPDWVRGLILVDLGLSGVAGGGLGEDLATFMKLLPKYFNNRDEARDFMAKNCPDPAIAQYLLAVSVRTSEGGLTFPFDQAALIETIHAARDVSVRNWVLDLARNGMPLLVLRGELSLVWSHEQFEDEKKNFAGLANVEFREIPNAGHGLPFEKRLEFVQILRKFMV